MRDGLPYCPDMHAAFHAILYISASFIDTLPAARGSKLGRMWGLRASPAACSVRFQMSSQSNLQPVETTLPYL